MERPRELTVQEVSEQLGSDSPPVLLDVREQAEWDTVHLPQGRLVTQQLLEDILEDWERDTPIVCYCHHGIRSVNAALYLAQQGFTNVASMKGGIDAWSLEIDPALPRY